jgi:hypothetical protein
VDTKTPQLSEDEDGYIALEYMENGTFGIVQLIQTDRFIYLGFRKRYASCINELTAIKTNGITLNKMNFMVKQCIERTKYFICGQWFVLQ